MNHMGRWLFAWSFVVGGVALEGQVWSFPTSRPASQKTEASSKRTTTRSLSKTHPTASTEAVVARLDAWEAREAAARASYLRALWKEQSLAVRKEGVVRGLRGEEAVAAYRVLERVWGEKDFYAFLKKTSTDKSIEKVLSLRIAAWLYRLDPYHRSVEVDRLRAKVRALEQGLLRQVALFRVVVRGKPYSLGQWRRLMKQTHDRVWREEAWRSSAQLGVALLKHHFMKMFLWRNVYSYRMGFASFFHRAYARTKLTMSTLFLEYKAIDKGTPKAKKTVLAAMKKRLGLSSVMPWDHAYALQQLHFGEREALLYPKDGMVEKVKRALIEMGAKRAWLDGELLLHASEKATSDARLFDEHAGSWRAWASVAPTGQESYQVLMGLYGRVLSRKAYRSVYRTFQQPPARGFLDEVLPQLFALLVDSPAFVARYGGLKGEAWSHFRERQKKLTALRLYRLRLQLFRMDIEERLYSNLGIHDPSEVYWRAYRKFVGIASPQPLPTWGTQVSVLSPMTQPNAFLGKMIAGQLLEAFQHQHPKTTWIGDARLIPWLVRVWLVGGELLSLEERLLRATGQRMISVQPLLRYTRKVWR